MNSRFGIMRSWSIRGKLLFLLLIIFLPAFGIIVTSGLSYRRDEIRKAENSAQLLVQSLAAQQEQIATSTKVMLSTLAQLSQVKDLDAAACNELFGELKKKHPSYSWLGAITAEGNICASIRPLYQVSICYTEKHIKCNQNTGLFRR